MTANTANEQRSFDAHKRNPNYFGTQTLEWDKYHQFRPEYPSSLFARVFAYHEKYANNDEQSKWSLAADFGSGPGTILPSLLDRFERVIGSDLNERQVMLGNDVLGKRFDATRATLHVGAAGACTWIKDGTADLITAAEAAQWFDWSEWVREAHGKLKPGGTLAFWYYSPNCTVISHPSVAPLCNQLFSILFESIWSSEGFPRGPVEAHSLKLRNIGVDESLFAHEERHYFNLPKDVEGVHGLGENPPSSFSLVSDTPIRVSSSAYEEQHEASDAGHCYLQRGPWTTDDLMEYIKTLGMPMDILTQHKDFSKLIDSIHNHVGGPEGKFTVGWWCALVMASKKTT